MKKVDFLDSFSSSVLYRSQYIYADTFENPPKIANNAKNIDIGRIEITVHAIPFALVQASLPAAFVADGGQSIAASTSE